LLGAERCGLEDPVPPPLGVGPPRPAEASDPVPLRGAGDGRELGLRPLPERPERHAAPLPARVTAAGTLRTPGVADGRETRSLVATAAPAPAASADPRAGCVWIIRSIGFGAVGWGQPW
jgi:hypothetical protein